jgi:hypothetical protein
MRPAVFLKVYAPRRCGQREGTSAEGRARRPTPPMEAEVEKVGMLWWDTYDLSGGLHGVRPRTDVLCR